MSAMRFRWVSASHCEQFKNMRQLLYLFMLMLVFTCQNTAMQPERNKAGKYQKNYWRHLGYLVQIKNEVAERGWKDFSKNGFFQPIIYFTSDGTFAVNPNEHILNIAQFNKMKSLDNAEVIKLPKIFTDTTNFNFHTSYSDTDSTALYYQENILFFQSFDLTNKMIGITDLQDWSIMVIHELFHGYQRRIPEFKAYYTQLDIPGGPDEFLAKYYKELDWYKQSIHDENELLKAIWINDAEIIENLNIYDSIRTARIEKIKNDFGIDIREVEDYEIMLEGHARYFESLCKRHLANNNPETSMLKEEDLNLISNMFEGYDSKKDKGLYNIYNDRYYYQLGYNISMILEKYLPEYKESIYVTEFNFNNYIDRLKLTTINKQH